MKGFFGLYISSCLSNLQNFLATLLSSILIYKISESSVLSGLSFVASWLLPAFLLPVTAYITKVKPSRSVFLYCYLIKFISYSLLVHYFRQGPWVPYLCLAVSGYITSLENSFRQVITKQNSIGEDLKSNLGLLSSSIYLGMIFGGAISSYLVAEGIESLFYSGVISASLLVSLIPFSWKNIQSDKVRTDEYIDNYFELFESVKAEGVVKQLKKFLALVACLQGYHNVARPVFTVKVLGLDDSKIALLQVISTIAVFIGSLFFSRLTQFKDYQKADQFMMLSLIFMGLSSIFQNIYMAFALYFMFIFFFEISFLSIHAEIVRKTSLKNISHIVAVVSALSSTVLGFSILFFGILESRIGLVNLNYLIFLLLALFLFVSRFNWRTRWVKG